MICGEWFLPYRDPDGSVIHIIKGGEWIPEELIPEGFFDAPAKHEPVQPMPSRDRRKIKKRQRQARKRNRN